MSDLRRSAVASVLRERIRDLEPRRLRADEDVTLRPHARVVIKRAQRERKGIRLRIRDVLQRAPQCRQNDREIPGEEA
jgi:hypothetical protein